MFLNRKHVQRKTFESKIILVVMLQEQRKKARTERQLITMATLRRDLAEFEAANPTSTAVSSYYIFVCLIVDIIIALQESIAKKADITARIEALNALNANYTDFGTCITFFLLIDVTITI